MKKARGDVRLGPLEYCVEPLLYGRLSCYRVWTAAWTIVRAFA